MSDRIKINVRIRSWNSMEKEFGLTPMDSIAVRQIFVKNMKPLCNKIVTLIPNTFNGWQTFDKRWNISKDMVYKKYHYLMD